MLNMIRSMAKATSRLLPGPYLVMQAKLLLPTKGRGVGGGKRRKQSGNLGQIYMAWCRATH